MTETSWCMNEEVIVRIQRVKFTIIVFTSTDGFLRTTSSIECKGWTYVRRRCRHRRHRRMAHVCEQGAEINPPSPPNDLQRGGEGELPNSVRNRESPRGIPDQLPSFLCNHALKVRWQVKPAHSDGCFCCSSFGWSIPAAYTFRSCVGSWSIAIKTLLAGGSCVRYLRKNVALR